jgi:putative membrane protein insertion efficiency factor
VGTLEIQMRAIILFILKGYKYLVSPLLGQRCRFWPSCSEYAIEAVESHGAARGSWLAARRVLKCHPWHEGGVDPVPDSKSKLPS